MAAAPPGVGIEGRRPAFLVGLAIWLLLVVAATLTIGDAWPSDGEQASVELPIFGIKVLGDAVQILFRP